MSKSIKISVSILFALAIVWVVMTGVIGHTVQARLQSLVKMMNKRGIPVALSNYQRGWFSSSAVLKLPFSPAPSKITIHHGPILFTSQPFALASLNSVTRSREFDSKLNLVLGYDESATISSHTDISSKAPYFPRDIDVSIAIPKVRKVNSGNISITASNFNLPLPGVSLNKVTTLFDAKKNNKKQWQINTSVELSGLNFTAPDNTFTLKLDSVTARNLLLHPKKLASQVFFLRMKSSKAAYTKFAQSLLKSMISNKSEFQIQGLQFEGKQPSKSAKINGVFNVHVAWPALPEDKSKLSPLSYLAYLKLHYDLSLPIVEFKFPDGQFLLQDFSLAANANGFSNPGNAKLAFSKLQMTEDNKPLNLSNFALNAATTAADSQLNTNLSLSIDKGCFNKDCIKGSNTTISVNYNKLTLQDMERNFAKLFNMSYELGILKSKLSEAKGNEKADLLKQIQEKDQLNNQALLAYYQTIIADNSQVVAASKTGTTLGGINFQGKISWPKENRLGAIWVNKPLLQAKLKFPVALVKKYMPQDSRTLAVQKMLLSNNCIQQAGDYYNLTVDFDGKDKNAEVKLGNKPLSHCFVPADTTMSQASK